MTVREPLGHLRLRGFQKESFNFSLDDQTAQGWVPETDAVNSVLWETQSKFDYCNGEWPKDSIPMGSESSGLHWTVFLCDSFGIIERSWDPNSHTSIESSIALLGSFPQFFYPIDRFWSNLNDSDGQNQSY